MQKRIRKLDCDEAEVERWETPLGEFFVPVGGGIDVVLSELEDDDVYSAGGEATVNSGDIVFDCGAHVGAFTRMAIRAGAKHVVAIEITPSTRECLERNLSDEIAAGKVTVLDKGVWHSEQILSLSTGMGALSNTVVDQRKADIQQNLTDSIDVPVTTIDNIADQLGFDSVDFIKMDIEGAERHAIQGASQTLSKHKPKLAIAAYHLKDDRQEIRNAVLAQSASYREVYGRCVLQHGGVAFETLFYV
ncbi:FkbM family methyltransferase [Rubripirellula tenax]|nr:FkbM family methyltransferase [Rubripirellula tenax]